MVQLDQVVGVQAAHDDESRGAGDCWHYCKVNQVDAAEPVVTTPNLL